MKEGVCNTIYCNTHPQAFISSILYSPCVLSLFLIRTTLCSIEEAASLLLPIDILCYFVGEVVEPSKEVFYLFFVQ